MMSWGRRQMELHLKTTSMTPGLILVALCVNRGVSRALIATTGVAGSLDGSDW
jgi:hypothetical protein